MEDGSGDWRHTANGFGFAHLKLLIYTPPYPTIIALSSISSRPDKPTSTMPQPYIYTPHSSPTLRPGRTFSKWMDENTKEEKTEWIRRTMDFLFLVFVFIVLLLRNHRLRLLSTR